MKYSPSLFSLLASLSLMAMTANAADNNPFSGSYTGVQAGYVNNHIEDKFTGAGNTAGITRMQDLGVSGMEGGIFAGYGQKINSLYLGGELEGSVSNAESRANDSDSSGSFSTKLENSGSYGATLRAGFFPADNILVYGKAGAVRGKFDYTSRETVSSNTTSVKKDEWLDGLRLGLGAETSLTSNITARADWAYTQYEEMTIRQPGNNGTDKLSPNANAFRIGVAYHF